MQINHLVFPPNSSQPKSTLTQTREAEATLKPSLRSQAKSNIPAVMAATPAPPKPPEVVPEPPASGVRYTPADPEEIKVIDALQAQGLSLEGQLELGKKMGLFTKITLSKDGVLTVKPQRSETANTPEFVSAAVATLRDYAEGLATLNRNLNNDAARGAPGTDKAETNKEPKGASSSLPAGLQKLAERFHLFA